MLLGVPGLTTRRKDALGLRCLPSRRRVCVTLGVIGMLLHLFVFSQGGSARLTDTTQRRHCQLVVKQCGTPHCVPANFPLFGMA